MSVVINSRTKLGLCGKKNKWIGFDKKFEIDTSPKVLTCALV